MMRELVRRDRDDLVRNRLVVGDYPGQMRRRDLRIDLWGQSGWSWGSQAAHGAPPRPTPARTFATGRDEDHGDPLWEGARRIDSELSAISVSSASICGAYSRSLDSDNESGAR